MIRMTENQKWVVSELVESEKTIERILNDSIRLPATEKGWITVYDALSAVRIARQRVVKYYSKNNDNTKEI